MKTRKRTALTEFYAKIGELGGIGKGPTRKQVKVERDAEELAHWKATKADILRHWKWTCWAYGVSPVCTKRAVDPHELVRRSRGGVISLQNSVAVCRECHNNADASLGGNRLKAEWDGQAEGILPQADIRGSVRPVWVGRL